MALINIIRETQQRVLVIFTYYSYKYIIVFATYNLFYYKLHIYSMSYTKSTHLEKYITMMILLSQHLIYKSAFLVTYSHSSDATIWIFYLP